MAFVRAHTQKAERRAACANARTAEKSERRLARFLQSRLLLSPPLPLPPPPSPSQSTMANEHRRLCARARGRPSPPIWRAARANRRSKKFFGAYETARKKKRSAAYGVNLHDEINERIYAMMPLVFRNYQLNVNADKQHKRANRKQAILRLASTLKRRMLPAEEQQNCAHQQRAYYLPTTKRSLHICWRETLFSISF